jgi:signal transduction histidine kinase
MPVPGFEPVTLAGAIGMGLFGVAMILVSRRRRPPRAAVVGPMVLLALIQLVIAPLGTADPLLLLIAAVACGFHGNATGWRRVLALAFPVVLVIVALLVLLRSVPTGLNPDPHSGASAQWALGALVGGLALIASNVAGELGGLAVDRRLPWVVGISLSILVLLLWAGIVRSKSLLMHNMVAYAARDAAGRMAQRAQRLVAGVADGGVTTAPKQPDGVPWDSLLPGVVGVGTQRDGILTVERGADAYAGVLDSLASAPSMPLGVLVPLDPVGAPLRTLALRAQELDDPASGVVVIAATGPLFRDILDPSASGMMGVLRRGPALVRDRDARPFLVSRAVRLPGVPATLEMWPTRRTLLSTRSILPELLLVGGLGFAALAAAALSAATRTRRLEYTARQKALLEALTASGYPRFRYDWDVPSGRGVRDPRLLRQLGYDAGSSGSDMSRWKSLIWPADLPAVESAFESHAAGENDSALVEYRVRAADATWHRWVDRACITEWNRDGTPARVSGLCADLGPAGIPDDVAGQLDHRLERAAAHAVSMQALFGIDDRLLIASPGVDPFIGHETGGLPGTDRLLVAGDGERDTLVALWGEARRDGSARGDVRLQAPAGDVRIMDVSLLRLGEDDGPAEILLQARDVTTLRGAERRHVESQRLQLLGRLAGRIAHEINNPLGGLKNAAALLRRLGHNTADRARYADTIDREVENIAQVVRQLYETLEWGDVTRLDCSVPDVVQTALETLAGHPAEVTVDVRIEPDARRVAAPEAVVRLVVYTLLRNALNASPHGGTVLIAGERLDGQISLQVRDEGPGVPPDLRDALLGKVAAPRDGRKRRSDLILGLPFAREVLEVFDGTLSIEGPPGGGASFVTRWKTPLNA